RIGSLPLSIWSGFCEASRGTGETPKSQQSLSPVPPTMAQQKHQPAAGSGILDAVPLFVVVLLAAHVLALVFWMYKLASEKQPPRRKTQ
ncbi:hypothetical protein PVAP13_1NG165719, partial [Panicum virgatum]